MDQGLVVLVFLAFIGLMMIGSIVLNSSKPRVTDDDRLSDYERCTIRFTYAGLVRFGSSAPGHIGITKDGVVVKLLTTKIIPFSDIRSVSIRNGLFSKYLCIAYGIVGQDVRIYSKQPERLLADIKGRTDEVAVI